MLEQWKNITFTLIVAGLIIHLAPDAEYEKYLRLLLGFILLLQFCAATLSLTGQINHDDIEAVIERFQEQFTQQEQYDYRQRIESYMEQYGGFIDMEAIGGTGE